MKHQESRLTGLRWYIGMVGVGCTIWAWAISWVIVMWSLKNTMWVAEWLTYIAVGCFVVVVLLPSECKDEKRKERSKNSETSDG